MIPPKVADRIERSDYVSRDLSWLEFNYRVLDQALDKDISLIERLKFLAITASNLDEFFTIRVGSLYNYLDYGKQRIDYSGLRLFPFRDVLFNKSREYFEAQHEVYTKKLKPHFVQNGFRVTTLRNLSEDEKERARRYFSSTIFPMLTPMVYDSYHTFPLLTAQRIHIGVVTKHPEGSNNKKVSFIQVPANIPRFFEIEREEEWLFIPIEEIILANIALLFRNIEIKSASIFRITRNGDFTLDESDDIEANFLKELQSKLKTRRTGRVVRVELIGKTDPWLKKMLKAKLELEEDNFFPAKYNSIIDFTAFWQIVGHSAFEDRQMQMPDAVPPLSCPKIIEEEDCFDVLKEKDVLLHHPYNRMDPLIKLLESAAEDPDVLAIKITIYRLAKNSQISEALLKAAENGKHVSVLFEVKARFDEENNLLEAKRLQKAGCFVIYGVSNHKTHTKLLLIVRKEGTEVRRYLHMSTGNYNESTSRLYTDIGLMTTDEVLAEDVSEFFNVITGHSQPNKYQNLITAPGEMRDEIIQYIRQEAENARTGLTTGIVMKMNSLQDKNIIDELYFASQAGVPIRLIVRGICCIRPGRPNLSETVEVISLVGHYLEHSRIYYFHNNGDPTVYVGSADLMVRSFDRRLESLFVIKDELLRKQTVNILRFNLLDNVNSYVMQEDGSYVRKETSEPVFNVHREFYYVDRNMLANFDPGNLEMLLNSKIEDVKKQLHEI